MKKTLFIIDAYNLIYRMFYAIPEMHTRSWQPVNAIFWVAKFLKWLAEENPEAALVVATDVGKSFRQDMYVEYKAQRDRMPDNLSSQIDGVFDLFRLASVDIISMEWYEADDIIGSIAHQYENNSYQIVIISSDKDLCQFVRDGHVHIYDAMKRKFMKESDVLEKFWVPTHQVCDYLAIVGDSSDNIPGISGFGPKKAVDLLSKYATLDGIYAHLGELTSKMQEILTIQKNNAFLSQELATIKTDLPIIPLPEVAFAQWIENDAYIEILRKYEFRSLIPVGKDIPQKASPSIQVEPITMMHDLQKIEHLIREGKIKKLIISTDSLGKIFLWSGELMYSIDTAIIDVSEFLEVLFSSDVELVGYNLKADIKRLHAIQKPLESGVSEEQGRLF